MSTLTKNKKPNAFVRPSGAGRGGSVHGGHGTAGRSYHAAA